MSSRRRSAWVKAVWLMLGGGLILQVGGCVVDPDLLLQAGVQFLTESAIFLTDSALVALR